MSCEASFLSIIVYINKYAEFKYVYLNKLKIYHANIFSHAYPYYRV